MLATIRYRLHQVVWRIRAFLIPPDEAPAEAMLSPALLALFRRMPRGDRAHSLRVLAALPDDADPDLKIAALLHDSGKSRFTYNLLDRSFVVLTRRLARGWYARVSAGEPKGIARAVVIAVQHPDWSAMDMAAAGASERAVEIARRHQDAIPDPPTSEVERLILQLQAIDDAN